MSEKLAFFKEKIRIPAKKSNLPISVEHTFTQTIQKCTFYLATEEDEEGDDEVICCSDCILWAVSELRIVESTGSKHDGHVNDFRSHSSTHS